MGIPVRQRAVPDAYIIRGIIVVFVASHITLVIASAFRVFVAIASDRAFRVSVIVVAGLLRVRIVFIIIAGLLRVPVVVSCFV